MNETEKPGKQIKIISECGGSGSNCTHRIHTIPPIFDSDSKVLILGSLPSLKSAEAGFFYAHPQNRFWRVLANVLSEKNPTDKSEKINLLLSNHIALWDVVRSCDITGSSDSSIKNAEPNDIEDIIVHSHIRKIYTNGSTAHKLYNKYIAEKLGIEANLLPSTSPANASWSFERLCGTWRIIADDLKI